MRGGGGAHRRRSPRQSSPGRADPPRELPRGVPPGSPFFCQVPPLLATVPRTPDGPRIPKRQMTRCALLDARTLYFGTRTVEPDPKQEMLPGCTPNLNHKMFSHSLAKSCCFRAILTLTSNYRTTSISRVLPPSILSRQCGLRIPAVLRPSSAPL